MNTLVGQFKSSVIKEYTDNKNMNGQYINKLLMEEMRWHYSVQYFAELNGEEVLENIKSNINSMREKTILNSQIKDEAKHVIMFKELIEKIGIDSRANRFANAYKKLVLEQSTASEKVFIFQILTEATSSAYCEWRNLAYDFLETKSLDKAVLADEYRHLKMGHSILKACDRDELIGTLTINRRKQLVKEMNLICKNTIQKDMVNALIPDIESQNFKVTILDKFIIKSIINELKIYNEFEKELTQFS